MREQATEDLYRPQTTNTTQYAAELLDRREAATYISACPDGRAVRWQSGYAEDCKSFYVGSIPARTSIISYSYTARHSAGFSCVHRHGPQAKAISVRKTVDTTKKENAPAGTRGIISLCAAAHAPLSCFDFKSANALEMMEMIL